VQGSVDVWFRVLGPLEACVGGVVVPVGGAQQRLLLSALLVNADSGVSTDALIELLWGDAPFDDASTRLAKSVYRLRATFASAGLPNFVVTRPAGYAITVGSGVLDSVQFEAHLGEAQRVAAVDPSRALGWLEKALGLWRGPAWEDVAEHGFFCAEVARLDSLRAVAAEERGEVMLALGRDAEAVAQLEAVTRQYPLRERPRAQLMVALYRTGRQADAMSEYRSYARYLLDEVGLEPSPTLRRLEADILNQRPHLHPRRSQTSTRRPDRRESIPSTAARFVGRREELVLARTAV
jgi:DNA-binding SARP family transcriptional activator